MRIPTQGINLVISIIVARILMPKDFGIMGITMMLIGYSNLLTNFGFNEAIIQKRINDKKTLNSIFTFDLSISTLFAIAFFLVAGHIAAFFKSPECKDVIKIMSSVFVITSFIGLPQAILRRDMNFKILSLLDLGQSLLMSSVTLVLALNNFGYWALAYGQLMPLLLMTIVFCVKAKWFPVISYTHNSMKGIINFGVWNFMKTQLGFIAQHTDRFIIGKWLGTTNLGFYDKALAIAETPYNSLTMNINSVMFSSFSRNGENKYQLQETFKKSLGLISFINFPIYLGLIVIAPYFVHVLLGSKWSPMIIPFQIILSGGLMKAFSGLTASLNVGVGKYKGHTIRFSIALVIFIMACILLVKFGIAGIALSYLVYCIVQVLLWMNLSLKNIDLLWKDVLLSILPGGTASALMFIVTQVVSHSIFSNYSITNMILVIMTGGILYSSYMLLDNSALTVELRNLVWNDIKKRLP